MNKALLAILSTAALAAAKKATSGSSSRRYGSDSYQEILKKGLETIRVEIANGEKKYLIEIYRALQFVPPQEATAEEIPKLRKEFEREKAENLVFSATRDILDIPNVDWTNMTPTQRLGKLVHATELFELAGREKIGKGKNKKLLMQSGYTVQDIVNLRNQKAGLFRMLQGKSKGTSTKAIKSVESRYSKVNQSMKDKTIEYPDSFLSGITAAKERVVDQDGDVVTPGIMDKLYLKPETSVFPVSFVNLTRVMVGAHYETMFYDVRDPSDLKFATDDTFQYNPLSGTFGPVVTNWVTDCLNKINFLYEVTYEQKEGYKTKSFNALSEMVRMVFNVYSDPEVMKIVRTKWNATPVNENGRKIPSPDLVKDFHFLALGFLYRMMRRYQDIQFVDFIVFSDLAGQNMTPFGACNLDSYKRIILNFLHGEVKSEYKLNARTNIEIRSGDDGYIDDANVVDLDGFGYLVDLQVYQGWSRLMSNAQGSSRLADTLFNLHGQYGGIYLFGAGTTDIAAADQTALAVLQDRNMDTLELSFYGNTFSFKDTYKWKLNDSIVVNDFTIFLFSAKNRDFLKEIHVDKGTASLAEDAYSSHAQFDIKVQQLKSMKDDAVKFAMWLYESVMQLTRVVNSGQIELAQYLISPILDIHFLDTRASRYNLPLQAYPSHLLEKMSKQQKEAISQKYQDPGVKYNEGVEKLDKTLRKVFQAIVDSLKDKSESEAEQNSYLKMNFNRAISKLGLCPYPDMDWGNPVEALNPDNHFLTAMERTGLENHITPYWILYTKDKFVSQRDKLDKNYFKHKEEGRWVYDEPDVIEEKARALISRGYSLKKVSPSERKNYEAYFKLHSKGGLPELSDLLHHLGQNYGVDTQTVSTAPLGKVFGLIFGGDDFMSISTNHFLNYMTKSGTLDEDSGILDKEMEIPTQSLRYYGVSPVAHVEGLRKQDQEQLMEKINEVRNSDSSVIDVISDMLNRKSVFGVPYTTDLGFIDSRIGPQGLKPFSTGASEDAYILTRNGLYSSRRTTAEDADNYVFKSKLHIINIPEETWLKMGSVGRDNMLKIHRAQDVILSLIQALMTRFGGGGGVTDGFGHRGAYMKVATIGNQLGVLNEDPLSFRSMYDVINKEGARLNAVKLDRADQTKASMSLAALQARSFTSKLKESEKDRLSAIITMPMVLRVSEKGNMDNSGKIKYDTTSSLEMEIIRLTYPYLNHIRCRASAISGGDKEKREEWILTYDKIGSELLANAKKVKALVRLAGLVFSGYGDTMYPSADFSSMSAEDILVLASRYKQYGPYRVIDGVDYPIEMKRLIEQQLQSSEVLSQQAPSQYQEMHKKYMDAYKTTYVARQSEKVGAFLGTLPVGDGYRIYLPYNEKHLMNVATATNPDSVSNNRIDFREIRTLPSASEDLVHFGSGHNRARMCIADRNQSFRKRIEGSDPNQLLHLVVVSPKGNLVWLCSLQMNSGRPTGFEDFKILRYLKNNWSQENPAPSTRSYSDKNDPIKDRELKKEREIYSALVIEFLIWLKSWLESPYFFGQSGPGNWDSFPGPLKWGTHALKEDWTKSDLYKKLISKSGEGVPFEEVIRWGARLDNHPNDISAIYTDHKFNGVWGNPDSIRAKFRDTEPTLTGESRLEIIQELKNEGKL